METIAWNKGGFKKGKALNAVPMAMGKEDVSLNRHLPEQIIAQYPQTAAAIKN
jgi:hypothetical protein